MTTIAKKLPIKTQNDDEEIILEQEEENDQNNDAVSFLDPNTVRWMNKRRAKGTTTAHGKTILSDAKPLVTPSQALYLRSIFKGLDYDNQGEISLAELSAAVRYVSRKSEGRIFGEPERIIGFFKAMDIDGNGSVDLNEFLIGMTAQSSSKSGDSDIMGSKQLQKSFSDFANLHRRRKIVSNLLDENPNKTELSRYRNLYQLFSLNYLNADTQADEALSMHGSIQDQINHAKQGLKVYKQEIAGDYEKKRKKERLLTRSASLYFQGERERLGIGQRHNNTYNQPVEKSPIKITDNHNRHDYSIEKSIQYSGIADADVLSRKLEDKVNKRLSNYPILTGAELSMYKTYTPLLETTMPKSLSNPQLPECFGILTSKGSQITGTVEDLQRTSHDLSTNVLLRNRRKSPIFTTSNITLEARLNSQQIKNSTSMMSLHNTTNRTSSSSSSSGQGTQGTYRNKPPILRPISTKSRMKPMNESSVLSC